VALLLALLRVLLRVLLRQAVARVVALAADSQLFQFHCTPIKGACPAPFFCVDIWDLSNTFENTHAKRQPISRDQSAM